MSKSNVVRLLAVFSLIGIVIAVVALFTPNINLNNKEIGIQLKDGQTIKGTLFTDDLDAKKNDQVLGATTKEGELKVLVNENDELIVKVPTEGNTPFSFPVVVFPTPTTTTPTVNTTTINNFTSSVATITSTSANLGVTTSGQNFTLSLLQGSGSGLNSDLLDGLDSTFFRNASNINAGTLGNAFYNSYSNLGSLGYLDNNNPLDVLLRGQALDLFVDVTGDTMTGPLTINYPYASNLSEALIVDGLALFKEDLYVDGLTVLRDDLAVNQNTRLDGTLRVVGTSTFDGASYFNFDTYFGNSTSDAIFFNGRVNSNIVPMIDNTYTLGTSTLRWANIFATNINSDCFTSLGGSSYCDDAYIVGNLDVDNNADILGSLVVGSDTVGNPVFSVFTTGSNGFEIPEATNFEAILNGDIRVEGTVDTSSVNIRTIHSAESGIRLYDLSDNEVFELNSTGDVYTKGNIAADGTSFLNGEVRIGDSSSDIVRFYSLVRSDFVPEVDGAYSLGSATNAWLNLFAVNSENENGYFSNTLQVGGGFGDADGGLTVDEFGALRTNRYINVAGGYGGDADGGLTVSDTGDIFMDGFISLGGGYGAGGSTITSTGDASLSGALTVDGNSYINAQLTVNDLVVNNMATFLGTVDSDLVPDIDNVYSLGNPTYRWAAAYLGSADIANNLNVGGILSILGYADVASTLTSINTSITTLQTDVTNLQTDVATLQSDMTTAQTDITNLQSDVAALQARNVVTGGVDLTCTGTASLAGFTCVINVGAPIQSITFTPITASAAPNTRVVLVGDPTGSNSATIRVSGTLLGGDAVTGVSWTAVLQ